VQAAGLLVRDDHVQACLQGDDELVEGEAVDPGTCSRCPSSGIVAASVATACARASRRMRAELVGVVIAVKSFFGYPDSAVRPPRRGCVGSPHRPRGVVAAPVVPG
jgi:hypothetical protein